MNVRKLGVAVTAVLVGCSLAEHAKAQSLALQLKATNYNPTTGVWTDSSGNGDNATYYTGAGGYPVAYATIAAGATPNGSSVVDFPNQNGDGLTLASSISGSSGYTVFAYVNFVGSTAGRNSLTGGSAPGALEWDVYNGNDDFLQEYTKDVSKGGDTVPANAFEELDLAVNSSSSSFDFNGVTDPSSGAGATFSTPITRIGNNEGAGDGFGGELAEIDIYTGVLTPSQISAVEANLQAEYVSPVPEPTSAGLLGFAALGLLKRRRRALA